MVAGPGLSHRSDGKTECTEQRAPGKRPTPAPYDKRSECIQGQAQCLKSGRLTHFPNLDKISQAISDKDAFHPEQHCAHLDKVATEFSRRFGELDIMEDCAAFVSNPFLTIDIEVVAAQFLTSSALRVSAYLSL